MKADLATDPLRVRYPVQNFSVKPKPPNAACAAFLDDVKGKSTLPW